MIDMEASDSIDELHTLGIDLDRPSMLELYTTYFNLAYSFPDSEIVVFKTGHGYHIVVKGVKTDLRLREIFGDDVLRVYFEDVRCEAFNKEPEDVLFTRKREVKVKFNRHGEPFVVSTYSHTRYPCEILTNPFNSHITIKRC